MGARSVSGRIVSAVADAGETGPGTLTIEAAGETGPSTLMIEAETRAAAVPAAVPGSIRPGPSPLRAPLLTRGKATGGTATVNLLDLHSEFYTMPAGLSDHRSCGDGLTHARFDPEHYSESKWQRVTSVYVQRNHTVLSCCFGSTRPGATGFARSTQLRMQLLVDHVIIGMFISVIISNVLAGQAKLAAFVGTVVVHSLLSGAFEGGAKILRETGAKYREMADATRKKHMREIAGHAEYREMDGAAVKEYMRSTMANVTKLSCKSRLVVIVASWLYTLLMVALMGTMVVTTISAMNVCARAHPYPDPKYDACFGLQYFTGPALAFLTNLVKGFFLQPLWACVLVNNFPVFVMRQMNARHRRYSVGAELAEALKDFDPDGGGDGGGAFDGDDDSAQQQQLSCMTKCKRKLGSYDAKVVKGSGACPAPLTAKFLAVVLGELALLFDSPMYAGWRVHARYCIGGGLLANWRSDYVASFRNMNCPCTRKNRLKHEREIAGLAEVPDASPEFYKVTSDLPQVRQTATESFRQLFRGDEPAAAALEHEVFVACDAKADRKYSARVADVTGYLRTEDFGPEQCRRLRLGTLEPSAVTQDLAPKWAAMRRRARRLRALVSFCTAAASVALPLHYGGVI
jgi:hypothetical protein